MIQIVELDEKLKEAVTSLEKDCEVLGEKIKQEYLERFKNLNSNLFIELVRIQKEKSVVEHDVFEEGYESFLEMGVEEEDEYYPNAYIPIWKCKQEWFQPVGYISQCDSKAIEKKICCILDDMLQERMDEIQEGQTK